MAETLRRVATIVKGFFIGSTAWREVLGMNAECLRFEIFNCP